MAFLVSPGVQVKEVDLTNVVPAVATSIGAIAGAFQKGPVSSVTTITSEEDLIKNFGKPNDSNLSDKGSMGLISSVLPVICNLFRSIITTKLSRLYFEANSANTLSADLYASFISIILYRYIYNL